MKITAQRAPGPLRSYTPQEEPPELRGVLFQQDKDGTVTLLKRSGESRPDGPPDIPSEAVINDQVFISVDGIGQDWNRHREQIRDWFHGGMPDGADLARPIIGIHEGEGKNGLQDVWRIIKNTALLKSLQAGCRSPESVKQAAYRNDPAVKTIYDQLRQSLNAGRQVTFMAHSGGGAQVALAMSILGKEEDARYAEALGKSVRVMGTAAAASSEDFLKAGVRQENLFMTGSRRDPVHRFFRTHMDFRRPLSVPIAVGDGILGSIQFLFKRGPYHEGEYIFAQNRSPSGNRIETFLKGGPGGLHPLP